MGRASNVLYNSEVALRLIESELQAQYADKEGGAPELPAVLPSAMPTRYLRSALLTQLTTDLPEA
jgi:hypothetical protein